MAKAEGARAPFVEDGHFYSPIHDVDEVADYLASDLYARQAARVDALLNYDKMSKFWRRIRGGVVEFPHQPTEGFRYYINNNQFLFFDSVVASAMLQHLNPKRIVEIGCGFSSAAMFDTLERMKTPKLERFTCIDPDMSRLDALDPPATIERRAERVQDADPAIFDALERGDILFIDSSHVLKAASDVHYEFLHLLPALKRGVIVHIHDVFYPFEYPRQWLLRERRAWNEAYLVDMLLSHSKNFEVLFFNHAMMEKRPEVLNEALGLVDRHDALQKRPFQRLNGSIWLRRR